MAIRMVRTGWFIARTVGRGELRKWLEKGASANRR